jgi:hypothetical protein
MRINMAISEFVILQLFIEAQYLNVRICLEASPCSAAGWSKVSQKAIACFGSGEPAENPVAKGSACG